MEAPQTDGIKTYVPPEESLELRTEQNRMQEIREGLLDIVSGLIGQSDDDDDDVDKIAVLI